ncbi:DUF7577 domain-containing protein [Halostella pelagica]
MFSPPTSLTVARRAVSAPCGTENDTGYRFCRQCVGELPRASPYGTRTDAPRGRETF